MVDLCPWVAVGEEESDVDFGFRWWLTRNRPGPFQIQAGINPVHADAATAGRTDWRQILALYDQLLALAPTPVVALNRAIVVAEVDGLAAALTLVDDLPLENYYAFHTTRADLLRRLGHFEAAQAAYQRAADLAHTAAERDFLGRGSRRANP